MANDPWSHSINYPSEKREHHCNNIISASETEKLQCNSGPKNLLVIVSQNQPKNVSFTKNSPTNFHGKLRKMIKTMKISIFKKLEKSQMMKLFLVIFNHRACFSKGINVLKPTFWTIANICPRRSPLSLTQYLFFGLKTIRPRKHGKVLY